MAELSWAGDTLVLALSAIEKLESAHGDLHVSRASVRNIEVVDDALDAVPVLKMPGARVPGWMAVGTFYSGIGPGRRKAFCAIHHDTLKAVRVVLSDSEFDELIIGAADPAALATALRRPLEQGRPDA